MAFQTLIQRYEALVFGICNRVFKNAADAEEITKDCFLILAKNLGKIDRSVATWLHSGSGNAAISGFPSEQRWRTSQSAHERSRPTSISYSANDLWAYVDEAIDQLPVVQCHWVVGYFLEGKPRHTVAESVVREQ